MNPGALIALQMLALAVKKPARPRLRPKAKERREGRPGMAGEFKTRRKTR